MEARQSRECGSGACPYRGQGQEECDQDRRLAAGGGGAGGDSGWNWLSHRSFGKGGGEAPPCSPSPAADLCPSLFQDIDINTDDELDAYIEDLITKGD